jgi:hypothetical protein
VPEAFTRDSMTKYSAMIYLSGTDGQQLDDAERCCRDYAGRFGWNVMGSIRDSSPGQLITKAADRGAQIILTGSLDMISPDQHTRDNLIMTLERAGCIVHPLSTPGRS